MRVFLSWSSMAYAVLSLNLFVTGIANAATGSEWLSTTQNSDGSYASITNAASAIQSTSESLSAFKALYEQPSGTFSALDFINSETYLNTENRARQIISNAEFGGDASVLVQQLLVHQNIDGGFGELPGYQSTAVDTAFALQALFSANFSTTNILDDAISYLRQQQGSDGSFALSNRNQSSIYITSLSSLALNKYKFKFNVSTEVQKANEYLLTQQMSGGGWSSEWESAVSLLSIVSAMTDASRYANSVQWLRGQQLANGSWSNDVFTTSLVLRALLMTENVKPVVAPTVGELTGRTIDSVTGNILSGVTVSIDELTGIEAISEADGQFIMTDLVPANYTLRYKVDGYAISTQNLSVVAGQVIDLGNVKLTPLPDVGVLTGTITDVDSGLPIIGAVIQITGATAASTTTNTSGNYSLVSNPGVITVSVTATGYEPETVTGNVIAGGSIVYSPSLKQETGVVDPNPNPNLYVSIKGVVVDGDTGLPIENALIKVVGTTIITQSLSTGSFELTGVTSGELLIEITGDSYQSVNYSSLAAEGSNLDLGLVRLLPVIVKTSTTVTGVVSDANTGAVITNSLITVLGQNVSATTNASGQYSIDGIAANQFTLSVSATGYLGVDKIINVVEPTNLLLNVNLERAVLTNFDITDVHIETGIINYPANAEVEVDAILFNSDAEDRQVTIYYKVLDENHIVINEGPVSITTLGGDPVTGMLSVPAGQIVETEIDWNTGINTPGKYQVVAQAYDGITGQLLAERDMQVVVEPTNSIGGHAEFDPPITQLAANTSVKISAEIINMGNQVVDSTAVTATLKLVKEGYKSRQDLVSIQDTLTDSSFNQTQGMDIDVDGNLYVVNKLGGTVSVVKPDQTTAVFADNLINPVDVDIDATGNVYILQQNTSFVVIDTAGDRSEIFTGVKNQSGIEARANGDALVTGGNALYNVTLSGAVTKIVSGGIANPHDMVVAADGTVYIASTDDNSITQYKNKQLSTFVEDINQPYGLAIDTNEDLIVTSYGDNTLLRVTPQGVVSVIATGLSGPFDVILDSEDNFVVSNMMSNEIVQIDRGGNVTVIGEATINKPYSLVYNASGELFVGNAGSGNIIKYDQIGEVSEFSNGLKNPIRLITTSDGGLDVLQSDGDIYHVLSDGSKTKIVDGRWDATDFIKAPDGNGYITAESTRNLLARVNASGQFSDYLSSMLENIHIITRSESGNVYAIGTGSDGYSLYKITPDYKIEILASGLGFSRGIAVDKNENIYLTEYSKRKVVKVDHHGNVSLVASTPFNPGAITINDNGNILLAAFYGKTIYHLSSDAVLNEFIQSPVKIEYGLKQDSNGDIWTSSQSLGTVTRVSVSGVTDTFTNISGSGSILLDGAGGVYVSTYHGIKHVSESGIITDTINPSELSHSWISTFAIDANGNYLVPGSNSILYLFDSSSNFINRYTSLKAPREIIDNGNGILYLINSNGIVRLRGDGYMPEVVALGNFKSIASESATTAIVSNGGAPQRLNLITGELTKQLRYSHSTHSYVESIAANPLGGFVMGDYAGNRLIYYDNNDTEIDVQAGIVSPRGIMFDQSGKLIIANEIPHGLISLRNDRKAETYLLKYEGFDYLQPKSNGNFYTTSASDGKIYEYNNTLKLVSTISVPESGTLAIAADGGLYATVPSQGSLLSITTDGSNAYEQLATGLSDAVDVEIATDGKVSITDRNRNSILTLNQNNTLSLDIYGIQKPEYISYTPNGDRVVTYAKNHMALLIDDTAPINFLLSSLVAHSMVFGGIVIDDTGLIQVSTSSNNSVLRMNNFGTTPEIAVGDIVFQSTVNINSLQIEASSPTIAFGTWIPSVSGEYEVEITANNGATTGNLFNTIHVGARADGAIVVDEAILSVGDQSLGTTLSLSGIDTTKFTTIDSSSVSLDAVTGVTSGRAVIADTLGNIYARNYNKIVKVTPNGIVSDFANIEQAYSSYQVLAINSDNIIYSADPHTHKIYAIAADGVISELASLAGYSQGSYISGIVMSYDDKLFALIYSGLLLEIDTATGAVKKLPVDGLIRSSALAIDTFGNFYITNRLKLPEQPFDMIVQVTPEGLTSEIYASAIFEHEGQAMTVDCANNVLFAPAGFDRGYTGEEAAIYQLIGDTGEVNRIFTGSTTGLHGLTDMDVLYYDRFGQRLLIYSDYSNGKVYSFPTICGGITVDAHIVTRSDVDLSSADPAPSSIIDNADGTKEYIWNLDNVDNQGIDIKLNLLLSSLQEGEVRNIFNRAYLEFTNTFNPDKPVKVDIDIPDVAVSSQMTVNTILDAIQYLPDSLVNISSQIANESNTSFIGTLKTTIVDAQGDTVESLADIAINNLASQHDTNISSVWNTGNKLMGDYTVLTTLVDANGAVIANSEQTFRITSGAEGVAFITSSLSTNKPLYSAWDQVVINGRVRNISTNVIQGASIATVTVTNPEGGVVHAETVPLKTLTPGSYADLSVLFELVDVIGGAYNAVMVSYDAESGAELTRSAISFTVERIVNQGVVGNISTAFPQLELGAANTCTETVTNISTSTVSNLMVKHLFVNAITSEVLSTQSQTLTLSPKESKSFDQTVTLANGEPGLYACVLQVETSGEVKTLATAGFEYFENPIDIGINLKTLTLGRVLVLLDSQTQYDEYGNVYQSDLDPHGPMDASLLSEQRSYLAQLLDSMGWSYTIVEDADSFTQELRSGGYNGYALFSEQIKLPIQVQEELREAVFRGEGLLVAGSHDMRNSKLVDAMGIKVIGKDAKAAGFTVQASDIHSGGTSSFLFEELPLRISSQGADVLGSYTGVDDAVYDESSNISVTRYAYGEGVSIFVGFDLLAQAAKASIGTDVIFAELLVKALAGIGTISTNLHNGDVISITLSLSNLSSATPGKAEIKLPLDSLVLDIRPDAPVINNEIHWTFDLAEDATDDLLFWLRLPPSGGSRSIDAQVFTSIEPNLEYFDSQQLPVMITPSATLASIVSQISDLNYDSKDYKQAYRLINNAQNAYLVNDYSAALTAAVSASSELAGIHTLAAAGVRLKLARIIRYIALQQ